MLKMINYYKINIQVDYLTTFQTLPHHLVYKTFQNHSLHPHRTIPRIFLHLISRVCHFHSSNHPKNNLY